MALHTHTTSRRLKAALVSLCCALSLTGCSAVAEKLPFDLPDLPELPFELPELLELPFELPDVFGMLGTSVSVEDARAAKAAEKSTLLGPEDLVHEGILTVGLDVREVGAPFVIGGSGSSLYGVDVDIASAVADYLGLGVRFVSVEDVGQALSDGVVDVVMDATSENAGSAAIVGGYYETAPAIFATGGEGLATLEDLSGSIVGVQEGSVSANLLSRTNLNATPALYTNLNEAFSALSQGEVNYVLCDAYPGAYLAAAYPGVRYAGVLTAPSSVGVAVAASNASLQAMVDEALLAVMGGGQADIVRNVWVGGMPGVQVDDLIEGVTVSAEESAPASQDGSSAGSNAVILY